MDGQNEGNNALSLSATAGRMTPLFTRLSVWEDHTPREARLQMAVDRVLLETSPLPVLRLYTWAHPCVTIGYFGSADEAATLFPSLPVVRRWTGGGTVEHGKDAPYSLIVPRSEPFAALRAPESYRAIHSVLAQTLEKDLPGVCTTPEAAPKRSSACFENPVVDDLVADGCKVAGAGQRRTRSGLLHQGSIQIGKSYFERANTFAERLAGSLEPLPASRAEAILDQARRLVEKESIESIHPKLPPTPATL